jgi:potassium-dependent mechanosensitive channel
VPAPIVRFPRITTTGLDFELLVFVAHLEDRLVVTNDLNKAILASLLEEKIVDPNPAAQFALRDLDKLADALARRADAAPPPPR